MVNVYSIFHYGRADTAVAYFGCKAIPADIHEALYRVGRLASLISSFTIATYEDDVLNKQLTICLEQSADYADEVLDKETIAGQLLAALRDINQDFREACRMIPAGNEPRIEIYLYGTGPFVD